MWLAPLPHRTAPPFNRSGLQLRRRPDGTFDVTFVYAGSAAAAAGLKSGDRILAIDAKAATAVTPADLLASTTAPAGTARTYRVLSGDSSVPRTVTIRLADLLP